MARLSSTVRLTVMQKFIVGPTTPRVASPQPRFGLCRVRSPLLTVSLLFSFPPATKMFQFAGFASQLLSRYAFRVGCPIRKSTSLRVFAPRRGFSQLITSFFASESLGILYVPLSPFFFLFVSLRDLFLFIFDCLFLTRQSILLLVCFLQIFAFHNVNVLFSSSPWQS